MARSVELQSVLHQPGLFWNDNPYAWTSERFTSDNDDYCQAPFHCHMVRDGKTDINSNMTAAHIIYGQKQNIKLGLGGAANANKWNRVTGAGKLFSSYRGPKWTGKHHNKTGDKKAANPQLTGDCFQMLTENQIPHPTGIMFGRTTPDELLIYDDSDTAGVEAFFNSEARWVSPLGIQFKWSSRGSHQASGSINFSKITLIYMDNWMPGRTLYMPLVIEKQGTGNDEKYGSFVNPNSFYRGSDPFTQHYGSDASGPKKSHHYYGEIIAYAEPEVRDYMADPWTRAVCVGMYIECYQSKGQGAVYDICREIFDVKLLFDMPDDRGNFFASRSKFIYPAPYPLKEALYGDEVRIT